MSIIRRYLDYLDRLHPAPKCIPRSSSLATAVIAAGATGYALASSHFGRDRVTLILLFAASVAFGLQGLVGPRWLRLGILPIASLILSALGLVTFIKAHFL